MSKTLAVIVTGIVATALSLGNSRAIAESRLVGKVDMKQAIVMGKENPGDHIYFYQYTDPDSERTSFGSRETFSVLQLSQEDIYTIHGYTPDCERGRVFYVGTETMTQSQRLLTNNYLEESQRPEVSPSPNSYIGKGMAHVCGTRELEPWQPPYDN